MCVPILPCSVAAAAQEPGHPGPGGGRRRVDDQRQPRVVERRRRLQVCAGNSIAAHAALPRACQGLFPLSALRTRVTFTSPCQHDPSTWSCRLVTCVAQWPVSTSSRQCQLLPAGMRRRAACWSPPSWAACAAWRRTCCPTSAPRVCGCSPPAATWPRCEAVTSVTHTSVTLSCYQS
jgi:hypothetical protein